MRRALAITLFAAIASSADAQSVRIGGRCIPVPEPDSMDVVLAGRVRGIYDGLGVPVSYTQLITEEIKRRIRLPQPLQFGAYVPAREGGRVFPGGAASATFALLRNGSLAAILVDTSTRLSAIDTAMLVAIHGAATDSAFPPLPPRLRLDTATFVFELSLGDIVEQDYSIWGRARVPTYRLSNAPLPDANSAMPRVTRSGRNSFIASGGTFLVVDDSGRVSPGTLRRVPGTSDYAFGEIARVAGTWRFTPARVGDCPVAVRMRREFTDR
jgi:hypothetical protein